MSGQAIALIAALVLALLAVWLITSEALSAARHRTNFDLKAQDEEHPKGGE